jgi:hypothetical protein
MKSTATASAMPAATSQIVTHSAGDPAVVARPAAASATLPIMTPPAPETWVKEAERSIVSRMYCRLSIARSWSATGWSFCG